jgi:hypothetical protein
MLRISLLACFALGSLIGCGAASSSSDDYGAAGHDGDASSEAPPTEASADSSQTDSGVDSSADSSHPSDSASDVVDAASDTDTNDSAADVSDGGSEAGWKQGPISGAIVHMGYSSSSDGFPVQDIPALLDEFKASGMDTIVLNQTRVKRPDAKCLGSASDFEWVAGFPDKLGTILDAAEQRGIKVWVGATMSTSACSAFFLPPNSDLVRTDVATFMPTLYNAWGTHPAFAGWYIPDEPGQLPSVQDGHYYNVTYELRSIDKIHPVMVCPYLVNVVQAPAQLAQRAADFHSATGIDVQAWQDSVGADAVKLAYWARSGYSLTDYFDALSGALGDELWADTELFNWGNPLFNPISMTGGYRSASAVRIQSQLDSTQGAKKRISWLPQYHMSSFGPSNGYPESSRLLAAYRASQGLSGSKVTAKSYQWQTEPSSTYPDSANIEMTDGMVGDPKSPSDPGWTGVQGQAELTLELGKNARVDWVSVHVLTMPGWSISAPTAMHLSCSTDNSTFQPLSDISSPVAAGDYSSVTAEEYVLGNTETLNAKACDYLKVVLDNTTWTFASEIEVYAN